VHLVNIPQLVRDIRPLSDLAALVRLFALFSHQEFDIIHTHTAKAGALGRIAAFLARTPVILYTPHGHNFYGYFSKACSKAIVLIEKILATLTTRIVIFTQLEKKDFIAFGVAPEAKLAVVAQGLELAEYRPTAQEKNAIKGSLGIKQDDFVVGLVSRLEPVKGTQYFIEACRLLAAEFASLRFVIAGDGSLADSLKRKVREYRLGEKVIFLGWRRDIPRILAACEIVVLPSLNEAVGIALIEAQAQGIPVVASKVGGIPEVVQDGITGILVDPAQPQRIAEAVTRLYQDPQASKEMGRAAQRWVRDKFSAAAMIRAFAGLYQELAASYH
jgi:glycosyltransferase involved in cell wall biosynthesis